MLSKCGPLKMTCRERFVFAESLQLLVLLTHLRVDGLYVSLVLLAKEFEQLAL